MQSRHAWTHDDIRWNHRFVDLLYDDEDGVTHLDYAKFDEVVPVQDMPVADVPVTDIPPAPESLSPGSEFRVSL
jgi:inward rectifier potassium channel